MAYKTKAYRRSKDLTEPVGGNGKMLALNKDHLVKLDSIRLIGDGTAKLVFSDQFGETQINTGLLLNEGRPTRLLRQLIVATAEDSEVLRTLIDELLREPPSERTLSKFVGKDYILRNNGSGSMTLERVKDDTDDDRESIQPTETSEQVAVPEEGADDTRKPKQYVGVSALAKSFF